MKKKFTCFIAIAIGCMLFKIDSNAQDIHFSQFEIASQTYNPATIGAFREDYRFMSHYKDQWGSVGTPYKTIYALFDSKIKVGKSKNNALGLGVSFYSDKAGESKMGTSMGSLSLSYHIKMNKENTLGAGIQSGMGQKSVNLSGLKWDNQFDGDNYDVNRNPNENLSALNFAFIDLSGGLFWNFVRRDKNLKFNSGISVSHINNPPQSFYGSSDRVLTKIIVHGGSEIVLENTNTSILPALMLAKQGPFYEINAGAMVKYVLGVDSKYTGLRTSSALYLGGFYRVGDAIALASRFDFKNNFSVGFSYDINVSHLRLASSGRGGMEVTLLYKGLFEKK
ncbi:MAG: PorP/SprF family type IX secretion system membrane protein [Bacteroidetes bacterium]|nr:PorP/SprF family type IX secretion system membrane protein [Bacteroidota bacterium]HET6243382.1 PorP/SprF family type IX secretion system membrane protein [Bacteroidia bacterium]